MSACRDSIQDMSLLRKNSQFGFFKNYVMKPITGCSTWFYSLNIMYWNNHRHTFSRRAITLENGRILDRFQAAVLI